MRGSFPYGLQDPVLGQALNFAVYETTPFTQVLHDESLHWIAISICHYQEGEVFLWIVCFTDR